MVVPMTLLQSQERQELNNQTPHNNICCGKRSLHQQSEGAGDELRRKGEIIATMTWTEGKGVNQYLHTLALPYFRIHSS
jgi:hypothetical protein